MFKSYTLKSDIQEASMQFAVPWTNQKIGSLPMLSCIFILELFSYKIYHLFQMSVKNCFIRGSVVRYVQLPADECDTQILQDAARKEAAQSKQR